MTGRTTRLDPRTNDPYFGRSGKLEICTNEEEIIQRLDILMHTHVGTIPTNLSYGIDYKWIDQNAGTFTAENALLMDLIKRIETQVEPAITSFEINEVTEFGRTITLNVTVRGRNGVEANSKVSIQ